MLDERFAAVIEAIRAGASQREAARTQGIAPRTVAAWLAKGRSDPTGRYGAFAEAVDEIREQRLRPSGDDEPGDIDALSLIVWKAAQAGSVPAMRLYDEILRWLEEQEDGEPNPFAELARRGG